MNKKKLEQQRLENEKKEKLEKALLLLPKPSQYSFYFSIVVALISIALFIFAIITLIINIVQLVGYVNTGSSSYYVSICGIIVCCFLILNAMLGFLSGIVFKYPKLKVVLSISFIICCALSIFLLISGDTVPLIIRTITTPSTTGRFSSITTILYYVVAGLYALLSLICCISYIVISGFISLNGYREFKINEVEENFNTKRPKWQQKYVSSV